MRQIMVTLLSRLVTRKRSCSRETRNKQSAIMASTNTTTQEYEILTAFLLSRASLQNIITFSTFTKLFPKEHRNNPQVKLLYRELQLQQNKTCERVKKNVQLEVRLGAKQRKDAKKEERERKGVEDDVMMGIEVSSGFSKQLFVMALIYSSDSYLAQHQQSQSYR